MWARRFIAMAGALALVALADGGCSLGGLDDGDAGGGGTDGGGGEAGGCNGDCASSACKSAGFACTPTAVPAGWTLVAYSPDARPICPSGFGNEQAVVSDVGGAAASCDCTCSGGPAECDGTTSYNVYPNTDCFDATSNQSVDVNDGKCSPISGANLTATFVYQLDQIGAEPTVTQGNCTGSGTVKGTLPAATATRGAACAARAVSASGCSGGAVCAPPTQDPFKACISHSGSVPCPTFGFSKQTRVSTATPGYVDGRACGSCSCATSLKCQSASGVTLFPSAGCKGTGYEILIECPAAITSSMTIASYKVEVPTTGSAACQPTGASTPAGDVTLEEPIETICCTE
jgi:hypothetical protein